MNKPTCSTDSVDSTSDSSIVGLPLVSDLLGVMSSKLRIVHHNVQGLQSKWLEVADWFQVSVSFPIVFGFSETWHGSDSLALTVLGFHLFCSSLLPCKSNKG